jgi:hypothetical protein
MKYSFFSKSPTWKAITWASLLLGGGVTALLARPDPPAADRLMDPSNPANQGGHLFFHSDDDTPAPPTASEEAFKNFKNGPATFAEFCKLHPLDGKPLGQDRLTIEVLATEVDATADVATEATPAESPAPNPAAPTDAMISAGTLIRQRVFSNSQAQTENVLPLDRQSDGSKMPEPAWEGERLFTCLEQTDTGYTLAFTFAESQVEGWLKAPASTIAQPIIDQREMSAKFSINPDGQWVGFSGAATQDVASDNGGAARKLRQVIYVRLLKN